MVTLLRGSGGCDTDWISHYIRSYLYFLYIPYCCLICLINFISLRCVSLSPRRLIPWCRDLRGEGVVRGRRSGVERHPVRVKSLGCALRAPQRLPENGFDGLFPGRTIGINHCSPARAPSRGSGRPPARPPRRPASGRKNSGALSFSRVAAPSSLDPRSSGARHLAPFCL